jgi:chromosome segregation ATPase
LQELNCLRDENIRLESRVRQLERELSRKQDLEIALDQSERKRTKACAEIETLRTASKIDRQCCSAHSQHFGPTGGYRRSLEKLRGFEGEFHHLAVENTSLQSQLRQVEDELRQWRDFAHSLTSDPRLNPRGRLASATDLQSQKAEILRCIDHLVASNHRLQAESLRASEAKVSADTLREFGTHVKSLVSVTQDIKNDYRDWRRRGVHA